jgi:small conductance mechanosensitive channel
MHDAYLRLQEMLRDLARQTPNILIGIVIFLVFYVLANTLKTQVQRITTARQRPLNVAVVLGRAAQLAALLVGALIAFTVALPGFTPANLVSALGITGIAVGFAFRDTLENLLAGILILLNQPFRIRDQIVTGNYEGTVEDILIRATIIRTLDGRRVVIPNADLLRNAITVNTAFATRQLSQSLTIAHGPSLSAVRELILATLAETEGVMRQPAPSVAVSDLSGNGIKLTISWWIATAPGGPDTRDRVLSAVYQKLQEAGMQFAATTP